MHIQPREGVNTNLWIYLPSSVKTGFDGKPALQGLNVHFCLGGLMSNHYLSCVALLGQTAFGSYLGLFAAAIMKGYVFDYADLHSLDHTYHCQKRDHDGGFSDEGLQDRQVFPFLFFFLFL